MLMQADRLALCCSTGHPGSGRGGDCGGVLCQSTSHLPRRLPYSCRAETSITDQRSGCCVGRTQVAPADGLEVNEIVLLGEDRHNVGHRHEPPDEMRKMILRRVLGMDGLEVALHGVYSRRDGEPIAHPMRRVLELQGAQLVVDSQPLQGDGRDHVDAAALHCVLPEQGLEVRIVLLVRHPHHSWVQALLVEGLALGGSLGRAVLGVEKAVNLCRGHGQPTSHEEEVAAILGSQALTL
mmetsp:Transcript_75515/g.221422  ORF Transcript_75515/g.221422 Transcript_75515/m.221422 type:complete len:238 (+) Transcript_75515:264-977(+)